MNEVNLIYKDLNDLFIDTNTANDLIINKARKLLERAIKIKLDIPRDNRIELNREFSEYIESYKPNGIKYNGIELIKTLNKFSHDTPKDPSDEELIDSLNKLNKILEIIFQQENNERKLIIQNESESLIYNNLNKEQLTATLSKSRITLVNAGPGTGKTHLIVDRILLKVKDYSNKKIIGISYTNQAANSLKLKLEYKVFGTKLSDSIENVFIGTIHSFAFNFLKTYNLEILKKEFNYSIIDEDEFNTIKREFYNNNENIENYLQDNYLLTFDKIIDNFKEQLKKNKDFLHYTTSMIGEIIIDEAQDINLVQYEIFNILYKHSKTLNLFLVGDQRQNIFDFLGGNLNNLSETFEENKVSIYNLAQSYRCPDKILKFVNSFKFSDCNNITLNNKKDIGDIPVYEEYYSKEDEAKRISNILNNYLNKNYKLCDFVVLSPSSFYFDSLADSLNNNNIPFKVYGGDTVLNSKIRFLLNLIKSIKLKNKYSLLKVISYWDSNIVFPNKSFFHVLNDESIIYNCENNSLSNLLFSLNFIKQYLDSNESAVDILKLFIEDLQNDSIFSNDSIDLFKNFHDLIKSSNAESIENISSLLTPNNEDFNVFFKKTSDIKCETPIKDDFLTLSTIHSAKGKEWNFVFIPGLTQDLFPRYNSNLNSELKKFYVACTRAKKNLYFFRPFSYNIPKKDGFGFWTFQKPESIFFRNAIPNLINKKKPWNDDF